MRVAHIPATFDYRNVERLYAQADLEGSGPVLVDARRLRWIDPNGMLAILAAARAWADRGRKPRMYLPAQTEVAGYLERMGFYEAAAGVLRLEGPRRHRRTRHSDVLLEINPVARNSDVHRVVDRVQEGAFRILVNTLGYAPEAVVRFSVILSEVCQNVIEHAEGPGWVAAQSYNWRQRLGRHVAVIAVSDIGRGFRGSLETGHRSRFGSRWGDAAALEAAFLMGLTRFADTGTGTGHPADTQAGGSAGRAWCRSAAARPASRTCPAG